jgi:hypothetical protein
MDQGDQIRLFFAYWVNVYLGSCMINVEVDQILGYFFHGISYGLIMTKNELGYILGDFFANSSGHRELFGHSQGGFT